MYCTAYNYCVLVKLTMYTALCNIDMISNAACVCALLKPGSQYDAGANVASVASSLVHNNYDAGAYVASVASSLVHNKTLELT